MPNSEKRYKVARLRLKSPEDARKLIKKTLMAIFADQDNVVSNAGKVANLLNSWKGLYELDKLSDLEKRVAALELEK